MSFLSEKVQKAWLGMFMHFRKIHVSSTHFHFSRNFNQYPEKSLSKCYQPYVSKLSKNMYISQTILYSTVTSGDGFLSRIKTKAFGFLTDASKVNIGACYAYQKCADNLSIKDFLEHFKLPDTFNSWFLMIQLHVWMVALVSITEKNGRVFRNRIIEEMWHDVEQRLNLLAVMKGSTKRRHLKALYEQFQAAIISYDEGILDDDKALAASVWRTVYGFDKNIDPRLLECIVYYIRRQISHLDTLNAEELVFRGSISFLALKDVVADFEKERF